MNSGYAHKSVIPATYSQRYVKSSSEKAWPLQSKIYSTKLKQNIMGDLLYVIAVILIIVWALGFFAFSLGSVIHVLLVIAIIAVLLNIIRGRRIF